MKPFYAIPLLAISALITVQSCNTDKPTVVREEGVGSFSADSLKIHVSALSHDSMMGRKPFTEGETKTVNYLVKAFQSAGLEPGNGDSYIQEVPMVNIRTQADPTMRVSTPKGNIILKGREDYVIWTDRITDQVSPEW